MPYAYGKGDAGWWSFVMWRKEEAEDEEKEERQ